MPHRELGLPQRQQAAVAGHRTDHSAEVYRGPPFGTSRASGGQQHPRQQRTLLHIAAETSTVRTSHSLIGRALSLHALLQACAVVRLLGLRQTVQPTLVVNKYCCINVILRLCSEQSYRLPHSNN